MNWRAWLIAACAVLAGPGAWGLAQAAGVSVGALELRGTRPVPGSATDMVFIYAAVVTNDGAPQRNVVATVRSTNAAVSVIDGTLTFGDVGHGASVTSGDTFAVRKPRSLPLRAQDLQWAITGTPGAVIWSDFTLGPAAGNAPLTVRLTPTPLSDAAIVQYRWDFDGNGVFDATDSIGRQQSWRYAAPGTYTVVLLVTDSLGRTDRRTKAFVVGNAPPTVLAGASPTNGAAPLAVSFSVSASDNEGVVAFEWDFDGDGTIDRVISGASGGTSFAYPAAGTFQPRLRVIDRQGAVTEVATPAMAVRVGPPGTPRATLAVTPTSGAAPLAVRLSATVADPAGRPVRQYQWDTDGDGAWDAATTVGQFDVTYRQVGTLYPAVRVTMDDDRRAVDVKRLVVSGGWQLRLNTDTIDAQLGTTVVVTTVQSAAARVGLAVERRGGAVVRTLLAPTLRAAGTWRDTWDGRDDGGRSVPEGVYHVVLTYEQDGLPQRLDLSTSTGGALFNPPRTPLPPTFEPFNGRPLVVDFTLTRAAEVSAFIGSYAVDTRYASFHSNQPFGRGTHRVTWNGDNPLGQLIKAGPGDAFLFGLVATTLPDNAVFVRNGVQLSGLQSGPALCDPTPGGGGGDAVCAIQFDLTMPASVDIEVRETTAGRMMRRFTVANLPAGRHVVPWDGKAEDGRFLAPGTYRIGASATQTNGFRSLTSYTLQRVYY